MIRCILLGHSFLNVLNLLNLALHKLKQKTSKAGINQHLINSVCYLSFDSHLIATGL
jgi:hypothetical protein